MDYIKKKYRELVGEKRYKTALLLFIGKIKDLTTIDYKKVEDALWDTNPTIKIQADERGNTTHRIILPPSKRTTALFEHLFEQD